MKEITRGIYQLKVPIPNNPLENTNAYLLQGDDGYLIIDPGMNTDASFNVLEKELAEAGVTFDNITRILATHGHGDHYGLAGRIKKLSNATIIAHRITRDNMQNRRGHNPGMEEWLFTNGVPKSEQPDRMGPPRQEMPRRLPNFPEPVMPDVVLEGGETIPVDSFNLNVIFTPGHDPGAYLPL